MNEITRPTTSDHCARAARHWKRYESLDLSQKPTRNSEENTNTQIRTKKKSIGSIQTSFNSKNKSVFVPNINPVPVVQYQNDSLVTLPIDSPFIDDQKLVLRGFQTLELIDRLVDNNDQVNVSEVLNNPDVHLLIPSLPRIIPDQKCILKKTEKQQIAFLRDKLRNLLNTHCIISLRKECHFHVKILKGFVKELKSLVSSSLAVLGMHLNSSRKSVGDVYFGKKQSLKLIDQLEIHSNRWANISHSVNRLIGNLCFVQLGNELRYFLPHIEKILNNLMKEAFLLIRYLFYVDIKIFGTKDQQVVPSELIQNFYKAIEAFNSIPVTGFKPLNEPGCFNSLIRLGLHCPCCATSPISYTAVLSLMAQFQGISAAGKILDILIVEWHNQTSFENKSSLQFLIESDQINSEKRNVVSTSDYYTNTEPTNSQSDTDTYICEDNSSIKRRLSLLDSVSFARVLGRIFENNQSSILKHIFAMTYLEPASSTPRSAPVSALRQRRANQKSINVRRSVWAVAKLNPISGGESSSHLEYVYWMIFWKQVETTLLTLCLHNCGNLQSNNRLGSFYFLNSNIGLFFHQKIKEIQQEQDFPTEIFLSLKSFCQNLLLETNQAIWDEKLCLVLSQFLNARDSTVPLVNNLVGTVTGNNICQMLETSVSLILIVTDLGSNNMASAKALFSHQCGLDQLLSWLSIRLRNYLSSWNIPMYLTIALSDLYRINNVLRLISDNVFPNLYHFFKLDDLSQNVKKIENSITMSLNKVFSNNFKEMLDLYMPKSKYWRRKKKESKTKSLYVEQILLEFLNPLLTSVCKVPSPMATIIVEDIGGTVAKLWMDYYLKNKIKFSLVGTIQLKDDYQEVVHGCMEMNPNKELTEKMLNCHNFLKMKAVCNFLTMPGLGDYNLRIGSGRNKIEPLNTSPMEANAEIETPKYQLTENEKAIWSTLMNRNICSVSLCC